MGYMYFVARFFYLKCKPVAVKFTLTGRVMRSIFQTNTHNEHTNRNCMRASLVSIFELNTDEISLFEEMKKKRGRKHFVYD